MDSYDYEVRAPLPMFHCPSIHMHLKCWVVNGYSSGRNSTVAAWGAKLVEACVLATQEGPGRARHQYGV